MERCVGIIGGGAAGMMAAITAARKGAKVTICEAGERLGQKILSTGNGKCNLGNLFLDARQYHGSCLFLQDALDQFGVKETISFFEGLGVMIKERDGYLYPRSEQASTVLDALRFEIKALGIRVLTGFRVKEILPAKGKGWKVLAEGGSECFDAVVITCGGQAMPKTGSDGSGYRLAKMLGHEVTSVMPALTFVKCKEDYFKAISGVRTEAELELLKKDGKVLCMERGELQITESGLSGIPVFQMSGTIARELQRQKEVKVRVDLMPDVSYKSMDARKEMESGNAYMERFKTVTETTLEDLVNERMKLRKERTVEECLNGILPKKLLLFLLKMAGIKGTEPAENLPKEAVLKVLAQAKNWETYVISTGSWQNCQVCAGGVDCRQVSERFESKLKKGIYFAGEILDVDGRCGGYNLQWAWTSGYLAGLAAAERQ